MKRVADAPIPRVADTILIVSRGIATNGSTRATACHKSNKIITAGGKIFAGWLDVDTNSCVAAYDMKTKAWSPTVILGDGQDNHAGPALAIASKGFLYILFGPHWGQPFRFRKSLKPVLTRDFPGKIADSGNTLGNVVFDKDGVLYVSCEIEDPPGAWDAPGTQVVFVRLVK